MGGVGASVQWMSIGNYSLIFNTNAHDLTAVWLSNMGRFKFVAQRAATAGQPPQDIILDIDGTAANVGNGLKLLGSAAGSASGVNLFVTSTAADENLGIAAKGAGAVGIFPSAAFQAITPVAAQSGNLRIYAKDIGAGVLHMFQINSAGAEIDLASGGSTVIDTSANYTWTGTNTYTQPIFLPKQLWLASDPVNGANINIQSGNINDSIGISAKGSGTIVLFPSAGFHAVATQVPPPDGIKIYAKDIGSGVIHLVQLNAIGTETDLATGIDTAADYTWTGAHTFRHSPLLIDFNASVPGEIDALPAGSQGIQMIGGDGTSAGIFVDVFNAGATTTTGNFTTRVWGGTQAARAAV